MVWPPFVWALVASENLPPFYEILNMPLVWGTEIKNNSLAYLNLILNFINITADDLKTS